MRKKIEAIVLSLQPVSERAHALHVYTREEGRQVLMVYGLGKRKSGSLYMPLSVLEIEADFQPGRTMASLREASLRRMPTLLLTDMYRQAVALFVAEVLYRTLRHPMGDEELYDWLLRVVETLDEAEDVRNVHLAFLLGFAARLGFAVDEELHPDWVTLPLSRADRQKQLRQLCDWFAQQMDDWQEPKSLAVLTELFDGI